MPRVHGWAAFRQDVEDRLRPTPHLRPLFHHVLDIPRRLWEYDPRLFIVFNKETDAPGPWEVHVLEQNAPDTFGLNVPFHRLDGRTLRHVYRNDFRVHGKAILERMRRSREAFEARQQRALHDRLTAVAADRRTWVARNYWDPVGRGSRVNWGWERGLEARG